MKTIIPVSIASSATKNNGGIKMVRKILEANERELKRLELVKSAVIEAFNDSEEVYEDLILDQKKAEFPTVKKYRSEDDIDNFYLEGEVIWIEEINWSNRIDLAVELTKGYLELKEIEKGSDEYLKRFEEMIRMLF